MRYGNLDAPHTIKEKALDPAPSFSEFKVAHWNALRSNPNPNPLNILRKNWGEAWSPPEDPPQQPARFFFPLIEQLVLSRFEDPLRSLLARQGTVVEHRLWIFGAKSLRVSFAVTGGNVVLRLTHVRRPRADIVCIG